MTVGLQSPAADGDTETGEILRLHLPERRFDPDNDTVPEALEIGSVLNIMAPHALQMHRMAGANNRLHSTGPTLRSSERDAIGHHHISILHADSSPTSGTDAETTHLRGGDRDGATDDPPLFPPGLRDVTIAAREDATRHLAPTSNHGTKRTD